jgi:hypothetical protein
MGNITKQQLENAARAMGYKIVPNTQTQGVWVRHEDKSHQIWNPLTPTTQGKADLLDLMFALHLDVKWIFDRSGTPPIMNFVEVSRGDFDDANYEDCSIQFGENGNEHAALAKAVVSVASQIWESKQ